MFELGFESSFGEAENAKPVVGREHPSVIGRYRVLGLIGEGGMGAVYEAEQEHPRRTVALKIIKLGMASPELLRRFEQESQALGRLQHPGIAQIFEAGTVDTGFGPQPYFAMELIRGRSLRDYSESNHLSTNQRLAIMVKVCDAVHHAHQRGLIHRDLKPGNIMVDDTGQPKILDFGVARVTDRDARATLETDLGQLVGTLAYMSPEQTVADTLDIDTRSDVYSLGVILYELLAGRLPYTLGKNLHEAIRVVREEEPTRLGAANRAFRGDIETIVAKALEKDRTRRYASSAELAADIQRYLNNEPIVARRPSASYQLQKFARRNRALVAGTTAVFLVLVTSVIAITLLFAQAIKDRDRAQRAEGRSKENEREAEQARVNERDQRSIAEAARVNADAQTVIAQQALSDAQINLYHGHIQLADREATASNAHNSDQLLEEAPITLRNWEWNHLSRRTHMEAAVLTGHREAILAMALSPDGKLLRTVSADNTVKVWDLETRRQISTTTFDGTISNAVLGHGGRFFYALVTSQTEFLSRHQFLDLSTGRSLPYSLSRNDRPVALSPNGRRAAALQLRPLLVRCWDTETGVELFEAPVKLAGIASHLIFSPDESMLAVMQNGSVRILNATTGEERIAFGEPQYTFTAGAFSQDGTIFVAGILNGGVRAWRTLDGREQWSIPGGNVNSIAWSSDSRYIATAETNQTIRLLDGVSGREAGQLLGHSGAIRALSFSPGGEQLVSVGDDKLVHIWNLTEQKPSPALNVGQVKETVVSPDGNTLLTATETGLKSWDTNTGLLRFELEISASDWEMGFSGDGGAFVLVNKYMADGGLMGRGELVVLEARTGAEVAVFHRPGRIENWVKPELWVSPNGSTGFFLYARLPQAASWHTETQIREPGGKLNFPTASAVLPLSWFSSDGKFAALGILRNGSKRERRVEIYDTKTGRRLHRLEGAESGLQAFSPVGNQLAVVERGKTITIWDAESGRRLASTHEVGKPVTIVVDLAFSPDGTRLATVSSDHEVWLWDTKSGKELILLHESSGPYVVREFTVIRKSDLFELTGVTARSLFFSRDGRQVTLSTVSKSSEGLSVRVETWDGTPRQE
jgi:serine/threonine protein kinase/WD40 repeat protein